MPISSDSSEEYLPSAQGSEDESNARSAQQDVPAHLTCLFTFHTEYTLSKREVIGESHHTQIKSVGTVSGGQLCNILSSSLSSQCLSHSA